MTDETLIQRTRDAFVRACRLDVAVRKPGNVSRASPGHGMQAEQFVDSAIAASQQLCVPGRLVGERIERAVEASFEAAGCNTNLGIILLSAPLVAAAERPGALASPCALRDALEQVLDSLTLADAAATYRAIARARPGGLGRAKAQDVYEAPRVGLRQAMALAAERDTIARQYADGYAGLFDICLPILGQEPAIARLSLWTQSADSPDIASASLVQHLYLTCLVSWPDTHIVRKWGISAAKEVAEQAKSWLHQVRPEADQAFGAWDDSMKARGWNPGTSADLTVATLLTGGMLWRAASSA